MSVSSQRPCSGVCLRTARPQNTRMPSLGRVLLAQDGLKALPWGLWEPQGGVATEGGKGTVPVPINHAAGPTGYHWAGVSPAGDGSARQRPWHSRVTGRTNAGSPQPCQGWEPSLLSLWKARTAPGGEQGHTDIETTCVLGLGGVAICWTE